MYAVILETDEILDWRLITRASNHPAQLQSNYCKVPNFSDARKLRCNLHKIQTNRPNLSVFHQKDTNGIAKSEDPDQTAPLGAV